MIRDKSIFITGGAGFIANEIISRLVDKNKIIIYDNFHRDTFSSSIYVDHKNISVIRGDVLDHERLIGSMKDVDIVIHAAGIAGIDTVIAEPTKTMMVNMVGTANVLNAANNNGNIERFIDFSTSEVFGSMAFKSTEDDVTVSGSVGEARWTYAVSKLQANTFPMLYRQYKLLLSP